MRPPVLGHQESPLVLSVETWAGPRIAEGILGCPVCQARYPIHEGSIDFSAGSAVRRGDPVERQDPMRLLAQLNLSEPGGLVLLTGSYASVHEALTALVDSTWLLVDAPTTISPTAVNLALNDRVPFADRALRGAAIDTIDARLLLDAVRCVKPGGRVVAKSDVPVPAGVSLIARDEREWVAAVEDGQTIQLRRSGRPASS